MRVARYLGRTGLATAQPLQWAQTDTFRFLSWYQKKWNYVEAEISYVKFNYATDYANFKKSYNHFMLKS